MYFSIRYLVAMCGTGVGFVSEMVSPPRSADVKTKCETLWVREALKSPSAWASSDPVGPWTVTQKTASMGEGVEVKMASGAVGSPVRSSTRESRAAIALALGDEVLRVRARIFALAGS